MKKIILIAISLVLLLVGCTKEENKISNENTDETMEYNGQELKIAVVGNNELSNFKNIKYHKKKLSTLVNDKELYDALIITKGAFSEADKEQYIGFYNKVKYPIFFFGTENFKDFAFLNENMTMETSKNNSAGYVQGFLNGDNKRTKWELSLPDNPTSSDKNRKMLVRIFELIESNKK